MAGDPTQIVADTASIYLDRGVMGATIIGLAFVAWRLFSLLMDTLRERVEEKGTVVAALNANTEALNKMSEKLAGILQERRNA